MKVSFTDCPEMKLIVTPHGMHVEYEGITLGPPHGTSPMLHPDPFCTLDSLFSDPPETMEIADSPIHEHYPDPTTEQQLEQVNQLFIELDPTLPDMYEELASRINPIPQHLLARDEELDQPPGENTSEVQAEIDAANAVISLHDQPPPPPNEQYQHVPVASRIEYFEQLQQQQQQQPPTPAPPTLDWSILAAANNYYNTLRHPTTRDRL